MKFECKKDCFACCTRPGFVYLSNSDISRAAKYLSLEPIEFRDKFLIKEEVNGRTIYVLEIKEDIPCHFFDNGCTIHEAKPSQCASYPFWPPFMDNEKLLKAETEFCPGIGEGEEPYTKIGIKKIVDKERHNPLMKHYKKTN